MVRALSRGPDGCGGRREAQEPRRGMKGDPRVWQRIRAERGEVADGRHARVFGMIGLDPGVLEPRDVGKAGWSLLRFGRIGAVSAPAPSCGGGSGWGVARAGEIIGRAAAPLSRRTVRPPSLILPHKGGGNALKRSLRKCNGNLLRGRPGAGLSRRKIGSDELR